MFDGTMMNRPGTSIREAGLHELIMIDSNIQPADVIALLKATLGITPREVRLKISPLRGGLDSTGVARIQAAFQDARQKQQTYIFIIKHISVLQAREVAIYREILSRKAAAFSPKLLWIQEYDSHCRLYLESIRPAVRWPWREITSAGEVLRKLAQLHQAASDWRSGWPWLAEWDYETELNHRGRELVELLESNKRHPNLQFAQKSRAALRRVVAGLPRLRRQLLDFQPFGATFIHGDVHSGNVLMRQQARVLSPVLLDWGRGRVGSPLEDVSSWLQSLGFWEPLARQRHDSLLTAYLEARGLERRLSRDLRDAYWLAAASNLLSGAILYYFYILLQPGLSAAQGQAAQRALEDNLRVIRRADACWSTSS